MYLLEARPHVVGERGVRADHDLDGGRESMAARRVDLPLEDGRHQFADGRALRGRVGDHLGNYRAKPLVQGSKRRIVQLANLDTPAKKTGCG